MLNSIKLKTKYVWNKSMLLTRDWNYNSRPRLSIITRPRLTEATFLGALWSVRANHKEAEAAFGRLWKQVVKKCIQTAANLLAPDKVKLFQSVSLSRSNISDRINDSIRYWITKSLKESTGDFKYFFSSLWGDNWPSFINSCYLHNLPNNSQLKVCVCRMIAVC